MNNLNPIQTRLRLPRGFQDQHWLNIVGTVEILCSKSSLFLPKQLFRQNATTTTGIASNSNISSVYTVSLHGRFLPMHHQYQPCRGRFPVKTPSQGRFTLRFLAIASCFMSLCSSSREVAHSWTQDFSESNGKTSRSSRTCQSCEQKPLMSTSLRPCTNVSGFVFFKFVSCQHSSKGINADSDCKYGSHKKCWSIFCRGRCDT